MNNITEDESVGTIIAAIIAVIGVGLLITLICGFFFWFLPTWNVWSSALAGKAELKQADWNRQVAVQEAKAKKDSASLLADAAVIQAGGIAKANKIIGDSLNQNEAYLKYLWIENLKNEHNQVIYVPTEGEIPILEAQRLKHQVGK